MSSSTLRTAVCVLFGVLLGLPLHAHAQERTTRDYLSVLSGARPSTLPDGRVVISMDVQGDLRGLLTVTLERDGGGSNTYKGTWAFAASYVQDLRADGSVIAPDDHVGHSHDEGASTPATHREYVQFKFDGMLNGTVESVTVRQAADGRVYAIETASLAIAEGSREFAHATGAGRIGAWSTEPGAITLLLNF